MPKNVLIIGAGLGGLATALRLAKRGYHVEIIEKNARAGGRLNQLKKDGFTFDTGPSFFSMSYEFREFADDCGIILPFKYFGLDPLYSVSFPWSIKPFVLHKDLQKLASQFSSCEPDFDNKMQRYLIKGKRLFDDTIDRVVRSNYDSIMQYLFALLKVPAGHLPVLFRNFWQQVSHYFTSDEVRQIMALVAFFLGGTPFDTPAVYTMLSYTEFLHDGYFNVEGGMYQIVKGIVAELSKENVNIHYNTEIVTVHSRNGYLDYLLDNNRQKWHADIVVVNADAAVFRGRVLKRKGFSERELDRMQWTMAPLTIYLGVDCKLPDIYHHNYYLGSNFKSYARKVFINPAVPERPYYYVNVLSHSNPDCAPTGSESLFFVCPVPDLRFKPDWSDKDRIVENIISDFSKRINTDLFKRIVTKTIYTPVDWAAQYNLHKGSGLGLSHKMTQIGAFRPANKDEEFENVFYVGASTVPGTGLPMVIISSKLAVERIVKRYGSV